MLYQRIFFGIIFCFLSAELYPSLAQPSNSDDAKAPGLNDRKFVNIRNMDQLAIVQPRELPHCQNSKVEPGRGITFAEKLSLSVDAEAAILINAESGAILYEKNAHMPCYPASITKIATAIYVLKEKESHLASLIAAIKINSFNLR